MSDDTLKQLQRMLDSRLFVVRPRMASLLRFFVEESIRNGGDAITQQRIATHALPLPDDFQPTKSAYVRTHIARLRQALRDYYSTIGRDDPLIFSLTSGPYRLVVKPAQRRAPPDTKGHDPAPSATKTISRRTLPTLLLVEPDDQACHGGHAGIGRDVALQLAASLVESPFVTAAGPLTRERLATKAAPLIDVACLWGHDYVCDASITPAGTSSLVCTVTATDVHHRQTIVEDSTTIREAGREAAANSVAEWLFHSLSEAFMIRRMDTHGGGGR